MPRLPNPEPVLEHRPRITRALIRWGRRNARAYPWREQLPLWQGLIAEVMLQRTRADQVVPTFNEFRDRYPSPAALACASNEELSGLVEPLGLRWRARLLHRLAQEIARLHGELPLDQPALEALPGVGPYAASATLSLHANRRAVLIDSNFVRVLCRLVEPPTMARLVGSDGSASWPRPLHRRVHIALTTMPYSTWQRLCACLARQSATSAPFSIGVQRG